MKRWNRILSILMALTLVCTTFGSDLASTRVYAVGSDEELALYENEIQTVEWESVSEESSGGSEEASPEESKDEESSPVETETEASQDESAPEEVESAAEGASTEDPVAEEAVDAADAETEETDASTEAISAEAEGELPEAAIDEEAETEKEDEKSEKEEKPEKEEKSEKEEKLVKVEYKVTSGGKFVSDANHSETINILDEEASFKGTEVEALNEAFEFVNWTDEEGNEVGTGLTFVPKDVTEDAVFTANFRATEKIENYPAIERNDVHAGGLVVSLRADDGAFPEGTTVEINGISDSQALSTAQDELGEGVTAAVGVDITFYYEGAEIQPAADSFVHVSLDIEKTIEGTEFAVLHDHDGSVEQIDASISTEETEEAKVVTDVEFSVNEFSIFIIAAKDTTHDDSADELRVATYEFYFGEELISTQVVKNGEALEDPGIPKNLTAQQEFKGWIIENETTKLAFPYTVALPEEVPVGTVIKVFADYTTEYYVSFRGLDNEVVYTKKVEASSGGETPTVTVDEIKVTVDRSKHQAQKGWTTVKGSRAGLIENDSLPVDKDMDIYAFVIEAYYIYFDENDGGSGGGASYTGPVFAEEGEVPQEPAEPTRKGYVFGGWYKSKDSFTDANKFDWTKKIEESITSGQEITLYAKWDEAEDTEYTIIVWKQKITDSLGMSDNEKNYDYLTSYVKTAATNASVAVTGTNSAIVKVADAFVYNSSSESSKLNGFHYLRSTVVDGKDVSTDLVGRKGDTVINIYYDRNEMTIVFNNGTGKSYEETTDTSISPLYGKFGNTYVPVQQNSHGVWGYYSNYGNKFHSINDYTKTYGQGDGKLYKEVASAEFKGLYGQRLSDCGYTWPSGNWYEKDNSTHLTFLDAFIFDQLQTEDVQKTILILTKHSATSYVGDTRFIKQSVDGLSWFESTADAQQHRGAWIVTEKYSGFKYQSYSTDGGTTWKDDVKLNHTIYTNTDIQIRYERLKYDLVFMYGDEQVGIESGVYYETPLSNYAAKAKSIEDTINNRYTNSSRQQFKFVGWYEDKTLTKEIKFSETSEIMPVDGKTVYAKVEPIRYHVLLDPNGGKLIDGQSADFWLDWGEDIKKDSLTATTRDGGYDLIGWFYYTKDTAGNPVYGDMYIYGSKVTSDVSIIAKWRNKDSINVKYTVDAYVGDHVIVPTDGLEYATGSTIRVLARPTDFNEDKYIFTGWELIDKDGNSKGIFYPNDFFELTEDLVNNQNKVTLKAVFKEKTTKTTTYVYDANHAGGGRTAAETVEVNKAFTVKTFNETGLTEKQKAVFKGWSVNKSATVPEIQPGDLYVAADNNGGAESNVLYAVWTDLYTVTWVNYDDFELEKDENVEAGTMPEYNSEEPTRPEDESYTYEFIGWTPELTPVTADITYKATYNEIPKPVVDVVITANSNIEGNIYNGDSENPYFVDGFTWIAKDASDNEITGEDKAKITVAIKSESKSKNLLKGVDAKTYTTDLAASDFEVKTTDYKLGSVTVENGQLIIEKLPITINITGHKSPEAGKTNIADGTEYTVEGYDIAFEAATSAKQKADGSKETLALTADEVEALHGTGDDSIEFTGTAKVTQSIAGIYPMGLTKDQFSSKKTDNFDVTINVVDGELVIENPTEAKYVLVLTTGNASSIYNGAEQSIPRIPTVEANIKGTQPLALGRLLDPIRGIFTIVASAAGDEVEFEVDGKSFIAKNIGVTATGKNVGPYDFTLDNPIEIEFKAGGDASALFEVETNFGQLNITPAPLQITTNPNNKVYDGTAITAGGSLTGLVAGETATLVTTGSQTAAGSSPNTYRIEWGTASPSNYSVSETIGQLEITPAPLQVVTYSATKDFDDTPLTAGGSLTGLVAGETATLVTTGSQTAVGSSPNTYRIDWGTASPSNYNVSATIGTLTVNDVGGGTPPIIIPPPPIVIPEPPTPLAPAAAVLGERRELTNGQAVLGARRARTEDDNNIAVRMLVILMAAVAASLLIFLGRKKDEDTTE